MDKSISSEKKKPKYLCTSCGKYITNFRDAKKHPALKTLQCIACNNTYVNVGDLSKYRGGVDSAGHDNYCRWCLDGGEIIVCADDFCRYAFCEICIERNLGEEFLEKIRAAKTWFCFVCDFKQIEKLQLEAEKAVKILRPSVKILTEVKQMPPTKTSTAATPARTAPLILNKPSSTTPARGIITIPAKTNSTTTPAKPTTTATPAKTTTATPAKPTIATPAKPTTATPAKPTNATPAKPATTTPAKPATTTPAKLTTATPVKPTTATPAKPINATPAKSIASNTPKTTTPTPARPSTTIQPNTTNNTTPATTTSAKSSTETPATTSTTISTETTTPASKSTTAAIQPNSPNNTTPATTTSVQSSTTTTTTPVIASTTTQAKSATSSLTKTSNTIPAKQPKFTFPLKAGKLGLFSTSRILVQPKPKPQQVAVPSPDPDVTFVDAEPEPERNSNSVVGEKQADCTEPEKETVPEKEKDNEKEEEKKKQVEEKLTSPLEEVEKLPNTNNKEKVEENCITLEDELFISDDEDNAAHDGPVSLDEPTPMDVVLPIEVSDAVRWSIKDAEIVKNRVKILLEAATTALNDYDELKFKSDPNILISWLDNMENYMASASLIKERCHDIYTFIQESEKDC